MTRMPKIGYGSNKRTKHVLQMDSKNSEFSIPLILKSFSCTTEPMLLKSLTTYLLIRERILSKELLN